MLNLLHTFLNFIELNNSLKLENTLLSNNKLKNKFNFDESLKLFLKNKKSIGSKDRKLFANIIYSYYKEYKYIEYLINISIEEFINLENKASKNISENISENSSDGIINNKEQNKNLRYFLKFYLSIYLLNLKSNEIKELEKKYDFFELNKYYKLILSKVLNFEDEYINITLKKIKSIFQVNIDNLENQIDNLLIYNEININDFQKYIELLSVKFTFLDFNIIELIKSTLNVNSQEEIVAKLNKFIKDDLILFNKFIKSNLFNLNSRANLFIRIIQSKNIFFSELDKANIKYNITLLPNAIQTENNSALSNLESYKKGFFEVQDFSSQLVFQFVKSFFIKKQFDNYEYNILDYCAGGGGKSLLFADELNSLNINYKIIATDNNHKRLNELNERLNKNNKIFRNINVINNEDFDNKRGNYKNKFDLIIIDAPCSGFGTVKRNPDNKYKYNYNELLDFSNLQQKLIEECIPLLDVNGLILYITCSLNYIENSNNIKEIERKHKSKQDLIFLDNFEFASEIILNQKNILLNQNLITNNGNHLGLTIYPNSFESDGFYISIIQKFK